MTLRIDRLYGWQEGETTLSAELRDDRVIARIDGVGHEYEILSADSGLLRLRDATGEIVQAFVAAADGKVWIQILGRVHVFERRARRGRSGTEAKGALGPITAPMFATVRKILVEPGAPVGEGQGLVVIEAMKMELTLRAPREGRVGEVCCREGTQVDQGTPLVILIPKEPEPESQAHENA